MQTLLEHEIEEVNGALLANLAMGVVGAAIGGLLTGVLEVNDTGLLVVMTGLVSATISVSIAQGRSEKT